MRDNAMFNYNYLFSDHFAKVSNQAKLYYIALNFFADRGFVANPLGVLDSLGYDKTVFYELQKNEEILTLPDRCEIFITSYYVHNYKFKHLEWLNSPFSVYWKGKLYIKKNGVATFNPNGIKFENGDPLDAIETPNDEEDETPKEIKTQIATSDEWDSMMKELDEMKGETNNDYRNN